MKTNFKQFLNEQYTLTIEDSMDDFEMSEPKWDIEFDVSDIWTNYKKDNNINKFINNYRKKLIENKDKLVEINTQCWNDLVKLIKEKPSENKYSYLDKIYDWADKYGIKINIKK